MVARRNHHNDSVFHGDPADRRQRIGRGRFVWTVAERQIDDSDVEAIAVRTGGIPILDRPLHSRDRVADIPCAVGIQDTKVNEIYVSRDALVRSIRSGARACNNARDVRSVSKWIVATGSGSIHEIDGLEDLQIRMRSNAAVHHGNTNAFSCHSIGVVCLRRARNNIWLARLTLYIVIDRNIFYCRVGRHPFQLRNRQKRHLRLNHVQLTDNSAPGIADLGSMCRVYRNGSLNDDPDNAVWPCF